MAGKVGEQQLRCFSEDGALVDVLTALQIRQLLLAALALDSWQQAAAAGAPRSCINSHMSPTVHVEVRYPSAR
jgi:hypothetical protein